MSVDKDSDQYNSGESIFNDEEQKMYPIMKVSLILTIKNIIALIICFAGQKYHNFYNLVYTNQPQDIIIFSFICAAILYLVQRDNTHGLIVSFIYKLIFSTCYIQIFYSLQVIFSYQMIQPLLIAILIGPMSVFLTSLRKQNDINYLTNSLWLSTLCLIFMVSKLKDFDEMTLLICVTVSFINGCYMMNFMLEKFNKSLIPKYENDEIFIQNILIESLLVYSQIFDLILDCIQTIGGF